MDSWMIHVVLNKQITDHPLVTPLTWAGIIHWPCWSWVPGDHGTRPRHGIAPPVATDPHSASGTSWRRKHQKKNDSSCFVINMVYTKRKHQQNDDVQQ